MTENLIFILPGVTLLLFFLNLYFKGNTPAATLLFILTLLPLMDLKITKEAWGGFKIFDALCFYALIFQIKDFTTINLRNRTNFYFVLFLFLALITLLSGLLSEFPEKAFLSLVKLFPIFIFSRFLMSECIKDPSFHLKAIKALKVAYISALVFLSFQWAIGLGFTFYPTLGPNTVDPVFNIIRYPGIFYDSQAHGQFLAMGSFILLYPTHDDRSKTPWISYVLFALVIVALNLAGSRSAFGGFAIGLVIAFFLVAGRYRIYGGIALVLGYIIFTTVSFDTTVTRRSENFSEDLKFRRGIWNDAYKIVIDRPFLGIGSGNYQQYITRYDQDQFLEIEEGKLLYFTQPESGYLKILVELGILGFFIFLLYMVTPLVRGVKILISHRHSRQIAFLMASLISWLVAFSTVYSISDYRLFIMVACMVVLIVSYPLNKEYENG